MSRPLSLFFFLLLFFCVSNAQNPNLKRTWHWYFGNREGLDFSSGNPIADTLGQLNTSEGCAAISNTDGNLLFYTDGKTVWNRLHQIMPNGTGLMGGANGSSTQEALIIPQPLSSTLYFIFTTDESENFGLNGLRYSVVDMNLDGGNGDVLIEQKNVLLFAPCTEKLAAVNHCNDTDVWILGHEINNNNFRSYLLTSNGIDTNNVVISSIGYPHMSNVFAAIAGSAKFSPNGNMLCTATDTLLKRIELFRFDHYTGIITDRITLSANHPITHALSFSPDNTKLYTGATGGNLYQYDVSVYDSLSITNSEISVSFVPGGNGFRYMENGPDSKIYLLHYYQGDSLISVIDSPNVSGLNCNVNLFSVNVLRSATRSGLPTFNESYFNQSLSPGCATYIIESNLTNVNIFPNPAKDWIYIEGPRIRSLVLHDMMGKEITQEILYSPNQPIQVSSLPRGCYLITINFNSYSINKIIILN